MQKVFTSQKEANQIAANVRAGESLHRQGCFFVFFLFFICTQRAAECRSRTIQMCSALLCEIHEPSRLYYCANKVKKLERQAGFHWGWDKKHLCAGRDCFFIYSFLFLNQRDSQVFQQMQQLWAVKEPLRNRGNCLFCSEMENMNSKIFLKWFFSLNDQNWDNSASGCQAANVLFWFLMKGGVDDDDYDDEHIDNDGGWRLFHVCTKASVHDDGTMTKREKKQKFQRRVVRKNGNKV